MRTVEEIYQEMRACFAQKTGMELHEGCDLSVRLYALAAQVYALEVQADWACRQAFPQTAQGEYLDRHAQLRGLERKEAVPAEGTVRFTAGEVSQSARDIPAGTVCMTAGLVRFETTQAASIPAGELTADVPVKALTPGTAGNVAAGAITSMAVAPVGVVSCTNLSPCAGGVDEEDDEGLRARVLETFRRLPNGANAAFYQQEALSFDQVAAASVISRPRGTGSVDVVVATTAGVPGEELLEELEAYFEERREIAVDVQVRAPETKTVDVTVSVAAQAGWDQEGVLQGVEDALEGWFTGERLGQDILLAQLGNLIYQCDGVANYSITAPVADVAVDSDELPVLGTLTVEGMT